MITTLWDIITLYIATDHDLYAKNNPVAVSGRAYLNEPIEKQKIPFMIPHPASSYIGAT